MNSSPVAGVTRARTSSREKAVQPLLPAAKRTDAGGRQVWANSERVFSEVQAKGFARAIGLTNSVLRHVRNRTDIRSGSGGSITGGVDQYNRCKGRGSVA